MIGQEPGQPQAPCQANYDPEADNVAVGYFQVADVELRRAIIAEWEEVLSTEALIEDVCAICARGTPPSNILYIHPDTVDMALLRNDGLPEVLLPMSYNREEYGGAILEPKGMTRLATKAPFVTCRQCSNGLERGTMPRFSLANWLYYGYERQDESVKRAFATANQLVDPTVPTPMSAVEAAKRLAAWTEHK